MEPLADYLIAALDSLPRVRWFDDSIANKHDAVTIYEQFAFCFNTVLSDLAARFTRVRDEVVSAQIGMIKALTKRATLGPSSHQSESHLSPLPGQSPVHKTENTDPNRSSLEQKGGAMRRGIRQNEITISTFSRVYEGCDAPHWTAALHCPL